MTSQLNKAFVTKPWSFIFDNVLFLFNGVANNKIPKEGIYDFDISRNLTNVMNAKRSESAADEPFKAYWLPWASEATVTADLTADTAADFFFTSDLQGCRVSVSALDAKGGVRIAHIAGNGEMTTVNDPTGSLWRSAQAKLVASGLAKAGAPGITRSLTQSAPAMLGENGGTQGYKLRGEETGSTVVGRKVDGKWEFWFQVYRMDDDKSSVAKVDQLWP